MSFKNSLIYEKVGNINFLFGLRIKSNNRYGPIIFPESNNQLFWVLYSVEGPIIYRVPKVRHRRPDTESSIIFRAQLCIRYKSCESVFE